MYVAQLFIYIHICSSLERPQNFNGNFLKHVQFFVANCHRLQKYQIIKKYKRKSNFFLSLYFPSHTDELKKLLMMWVMMMMMVVVMVVVVLKVKRPSWNCTGAACSLSSGQSSTVAGDRSQSSMHQNSFCP